MNADRLVDEQCRAELGRLAFTAHEGHVFTRELTADVVGWVQVARLPPRGELEVDASIGVRHARAETWLDELRVRHPAPYPWPTVATNVGYLTRARTCKVWTIPDDERRARREVRSLLATIGKGATPFFAAHLTLEDTLAALRGASGVHGTRVYSIPVCLALLGRDEEADGVLHAALEALGDTDHRAAQALRSFAEAFLARSRQASSR